MQQKKGIIIATVVLFGTLSVGGTAYGIMNSRNYAHAETTIKDERKDLSNYKSIINKMVDSKTGYLQPSATYDNLNRYKNLVNNMSDSYVDFHIKKDALTKELKVIKIGKREVLNKIKLIEVKLKAQDKVNSMFASVAINGSTVGEQPIKDSLNADGVSKVKSSININEDSQWMTSIQDLINKADAQVQQVDKATKLVNALIQNDQVVSGVTRDQYNQALTEVNLIKNPTIKQGLVDKLNKVSAVVADNEAKAEAERVAAEQAAKAATTSSQQQTTSSRSTRSSNSGTVRSSSGGSTSGSRATSSSSRTTTSSGSKTSSSVSSGGSTSGGYSSVVDKTTGSGDIKDSNNTYETGVFQASKDWGY